MNDIDFEAALERRAKRIDTMSEEEALLLVDRPVGLKALLAHEAGLTEQQAEDALAALMGMPDLRSMMLSAFCGSKSVPQPIESIGHTEIAMLRPMAETLAILDGNAFLGTAPVRVGPGAVREWWELYVPEAKALFDGNGGLSGWAGEASFAKVLAPLMPWAARKPGRAASPTAMADDAAIPAP